MGKQTISRSQASRVVWNDLEEWVRKKVQEFIQCIFVGGRCKIPKKGKIKFPTSEENMFSYDRNSIVGGSKEDDNIGPIS
jgi:hypothetical protein